jgi:pyridine nucleotide-disulfide oxidoreductase family protein
MKQLILVGGGHAHLSVLNKLQSNPLNNVQTILISPSRFQYYSGMFSGCVEGIYSQSDIRVDLDQMSRKASITFVIDTVTSIDAKQKKIGTEKGKSLTYDAISFDIGSLTRGNGIQGVKEFADTLKPDFRFESIGRLRSAEHIIIVGGGPSGIETSFSLNAWRKKHGINHPVTLLSAGPLLSGKHKIISRKIEKMAAGQGIRIRTGERVIKVKQGCIMTSSAEYPYDVLFWLAGPAAPEIFRNAQLPADDLGYLRVSSTLQVKEYPSIFGAGDCVNFATAGGLAKAGVYAVRQGPVLYQNFKNFFESGSMELFIPQRHYLSILSLGNQRGLLLYGRCAVVGRWCWYLKNFIDQHFISKYQL